MDRFKVTLLVNDVPTRASISYLTPEDSKFLKFWRMACRDHNLPAGKDSCELAEQALARWKKYGSRQSYARRWSDVRAFVKSYPHDEVVNFVVLKCKSLNSPNFPANSILGFCHFRRTWCNNIAIDFLASHPAIARRDSSDTTINGVGIALLYYLTEVAKAINANRIWGEATQNSFDYYEKSLQLTSVKDLFIIDAERYRMINELCAEKLKGRDHENV